MAINVTGSESNGKERECALTVIRMEYMAINVITFIARERRERL